MDKIENVPDDNPLADSVGRDRRIRERAYHLWESEGRIHGRDDDYWERARELEAMASASGSGQMPVDQPERVDEAALQDNLGEFPGRFADQGEQQPTPMPRAKLTDALE